MNEGALPELPGGWVWTRLGEICLDPQYGWTTSAIMEGTLHLLRTTDITSGSIDWNTVPFCKEEPPEKEKYLLNDGDIVISRAGSVGYSHLIKNPKEAIFASYLIRFRPLIDEKYLAFFIKSPLYWDSISEKSLGIAIPNVNASKLKQISIPLPPLPEQRRIVTKIEELFTKLDAGVSALQKTQAQLKRYRQSVLKAACEGKLVPTEAEIARAEGRAYEPADVLLARILKERREKSKGAKYKEPEAPDTNGLHVLPEGGAWTRLRELTDLSSGMAFKKSEYAEQGIRLFQIANVSFGGILWDNVVYMPTNYFEKYPELVLKPGDILMALNRPIIGGKLKIGVLKERDTPAILYQRVGRFDFYNASIKPYFFIYSQSLYFIDRLKNSLQGVDQPFVNKPKLLDIPIPLPPLAEQRRVVAEVERRLSVADEVAKTVEQSLAQAERLRQSILKKAFEGKLVAQNFEDEPAGVLLEKIRLQKQLEIKKGRSKR